MTNFNKCYPFQLLPLPYSYDALEPFIDTKTMQIHHDKHLKKYVDNLNKALEGFPSFQCFTLGELINRNLVLPYSIQTAVASNAGGVYNHEVFFNSMSDKPAHRANGPLGCIIERKFHSFDNFKEKFKEAALKLFGSGYVVLASDKKCNLKIIMTPNQCTVIQLGLIPLISIDLWEHAYYLKHQNDRAGYIDDWFCVADWEVAERRFARLLH